MPTSREHRISESYHSKLCLKVAECCVPEAESPMYSERMEFVSWDEPIQIEYWIMRLKGESHNIAKMCALQRGPYLLTDNVWNTGRVNNNQFANCPELGKYYKEKAEKAGVSTTGKYYVHGLGRFPGDPLAWCRGRGDALERARDRNVGLSGLVEYKAHDVDPEPDVELAEDLWEGAAQEILEGNPDMKYDDAREKAFNLRTGRDRSPDKDLGYVPHPADVLAAEGL